MSRGIAHRGGKTTRVLAALVVVVACLGAVAYAAERPRQSREPDARPAGPAPQRPRIVKHPAAVSTATTVNFTFTATPASLRFRCRLDRNRWRSCQSPATFAGLEPGPHSFAVRAVSRLGRSGPAAGLRWTLLKPKAFAIEPQFSDVGALFPGEPPRPLPVLLRNPNPVPILVTKLRVAVSADPPGCGSAANFELIPASPSRRTPLRLPAGGSLGLPSASATAPAIALRDLPVNQDACQGAKLPLSFSGEARG
ncbi:MAG TPA: hypothetical protein VFX85_08395 [Solirubrobacterales bacterium]|nr:hypothetical protein [Solirubrobacterales bacterium]